MNDGLTLIKQRKGLFLNLNSERSFADFGRKNLQKKNKWWSFNFRKVILNVKKKKRKKKSRPVEVFYHHSGQTTTMGAVKVKYYNCFYVRRTIQMIILLNNSLK